jgi:predicted regulator of Ras-like GTPase activity (Roadblock/LC7/MglB family)
VSGREKWLLNRILEDLISSVSGARAAIFLDGEGEFIAQAGDAAVDLKLIGAWKEIQLDRIKDIAGRLGLGGVHAVLFSVEEGTELVVPVSEDYCLLLFLSAYANIQEAMERVAATMNRLKKEIE